VSWATCYWLTLPSTPRTSFLRYNCIYKYHRFTYLEFPPLLPKSAQHQVDLSFFSIKMRLKLCAALAWATLFSHSLAVYDVPSVLPRETNECQDSDRMYSSEDIPQGAVEPWTSDGTQLDSAHSDGLQYVYSSSTFTSILIYYLRTCPSKPNEGLLTLEIIIGGLLL
jgi:hypothetical protein